MAVLPSLLTLVLTLPSSAGTLPRFLGELLAEAPQWAQELPLSLGHALGGREAIQQLVWAGAPFPSALDDDFQLLELEPFAAGIWWVSYKAKDKKTGKTVALKLLRKSPDGAWLTTDDSEVYGGMIQYTRNECLNATDVHKNSQEDAEGGEFLSECVIDGISTAKPATPLYIAMEWGGPTLRKFWEDHQQDTVDANQKLLWTLTRQMMMGLRCMSNPKADVQWVHHNFNPDNLRVLAGGDATTLKISGFGDVLSSKDPSGVSGSNTWFRPPEYAGLKPLVGFSPPVHSYDASSAALTLLSFLSGDPIPDFYFSALLSSLLKQAELYMPTRIANCILEKTGARDNFQKFIDSWERCVTKVEKDMDFEAELEEELGPLRDSSTKTGRMHQLMRLTTCPSLKPFAGDETLVQAVIAEWVDTSFDKVLVSMLHPNPAKRPTPEEVLSSEWLKGRRRPSISVPKIECPVSKLQSTMQQVVEMAVGVVISVIALLVTGACATCCCCCGTCCSLIGSAPSASWTGLVIATYVLGGAVASHLWLSCTAGTVLEVLGFALGIALIASGCIMARSAPPAHAKLAWVVALVCALLFCIGLFLGLRASAGPLLSVVGYVRRHASDLEATLEDNADDVLKLVEALETFIWFTLYPPVFGTLVSCFGLWRAHQRTQRERRASQVVVSSGTEMRTSLP